MTQPTKHIKAIIVDDSAQARKLLRLMIQELANDVSILGEAENVNEAVDLIKKQKPDVVFLDIEMPGKSGLQLVEEISKEEANYDIIFTTAYNDYALKAFRLSAIDYLLKPIDEQQLEEAIAKLRERKLLKDNKKQFDTLKYNLSNNSDSIICIPMLNGNEYVYLKSIEFLEAEGSYVKIHLVEQKQKVVAKNLKYFENALQNSPIFFRAHRSYLLNLQHVKKFEKGKIITTTGAEIDLARERKNDFLQAMEKIQKG
jgi:two-component system LytT family response regulator